MPRLETSRMVCDTLHHANGILSVVVAIVPLRKQGSIGMYPRKQTSCCIRLIAEWFHTGLCPSGRVWCWIEW